MILDIKNNQVVNYNISHNTTFSSSGVTGNRKVVKTDVYLAPRSGLAVKHGAGVINEDYRGTV